MKEKSPLHYLASVINNLLHRVNVIESELEIISNLAGERLIRIRELEEQVDSFKCPICGQVMKAVYAHDIDYKKINPGAPTVFELFVSCSHPPIKK